MRDVYPQKTAHPNEKALVRSERYENTLVFMSGLQLRDWAPPLTDLQTLPAPETMRFHNFRSCRTSRSVRTSDLDLLTHPLLQSSFH
jgi:hypothetical protein